MSAQGLRPVRFLGPNHSRHRDLPFLVCQATDRYPSSNGHSAAKIPTRAPSGCYPLRRPALRDLTRDIRRDCLLDSSDVLLTAMTSFEFCATTARTGIISSQFFDLPKGGDVFRLLEIHRPRWVSHSGSVFVD